MQTTKTTDDWTCLLFKHLTKLRARMSDPVGNTSQKMRWEELVQHYAPRGDSWQSNMKAKTPQFGDCKTLNCSESCCPGRYLSIEHDFCCSKDDEALFHSAHRQLHGDILWVYLILRLLQCWFTLRVSLRNPQFCQIKNRTKTTVVTELLVQLSIPETGLTWE